MGGWRSGPCVGGDIGWMGGRAALRWMAKGDVLGTGEEAHKGKRAEGEEAVAWVRRRQRERVEGVDAMRVGG